ncbi:MAG: rhodanese-like domain-containing protein [Opitutaceae bacterium]|nr:rhodanese-like domain-containing protein [Cytophagales bacterium]
MDISVEDLKERIEKGEHLNLIDVREQWEFDEVNIGAKLIPLQTLPNKLAELEPLKDEEIIIHCRSGKRSDNAKKFLEQNGFKNVRNVLGGIEAYLAL